MKITSINITGFGKLTDKAINFSDGLNVVYGNNEAGKTTTHTFIKSMLFGIKRKKGKNQQDIYSKYLPWGNNKYEGTLCFTHDNKEYQIYRVFNDANPLLEIREIGGKGTLIKNPELFLNKVLNNLTINSFDNTISIGQLKSAQDKTIVEELHNFIANINTSGDMSINTLYAINLLRQRKEALLINLHQDATMIYNKQLGNIKNIEKELSNKNYENKLPEVMQKKVAETKKINNNNEEIENLKKSVTDKKVALNSNGFSSKDEIDSLSNEANKIFTEYKPIMDNSKQTSKSIISFFFLLIGIILITTSFLCLVVTYPDIATTLNINNAEESLNLITSLIINLSFHPIILIAVLLCIGIILLVGNTLLIFNNVQERNKANDIRDVLSDIFIQNIGDDEVTNDNMAVFNKHMSSMKKIANLIDEDEARIGILTKENNILLQNQAKYDEIIRTQQRIQYDVEQKYNELYTLKNENEKMKQELDNNEVIGREIESIDLAIENLTSLSNEIQVMFGTHLNKSISHFISALTNNKYNSLNVDNSLNVTINYNDSVIPLNKISTGTIDQIYLALRLAIAEIICKNKESLPLLFDDCFAMYDNERLESTLKYLANNINSQIIIFSCHTRERALLSHNQINFNSIEI